MNQEEVALAPPPEHLPPLLPASSPPSSSFCKTKQPRHDHDERSTRFDKYVSVHVIENAIEEYTPEEREAVWYSREELRKQRRKSRQLAETMDFYSDEDLFDRFGVMSLQRHLDRMRQIGEVTDCVLALYQEVGLPFWGVGVMGERLLNEEQEEIFEIYVRNTNYCSRMAKCRATRIEKKIGIF